MALRFADGFDHYATADIDMKWTSHSGGTIGVTGRNGNGIRFGSFGENCSKTLGNQATWVVGVAFLAEDVSAMTDRPIICLLDTGNIQCDVRILPNGTITVTRNGTVLETSVNALASGTWYFVEFKCTVDNAGSYEVRVNGTSVNWIPPDSGDTQATGNAYANQVQIMNPGTAKCGDFDDLYVLDGTAGLNDFIGDVWVDTLLPNGNGSNSDFMGSDADKVDNYVQVADNPQDGDTSFNYSSNPGDYDTYDFEDTTSTIIKGAQLNLIARKDAAGARTFAAACVSGGDTYDGATQAPGMTYSDYMEVYEEDPDTSSAWVAANLNDAEFGLKVVA